MRIRTFALLFGFVTMTVPSVGAQEPADPFQWLEDVGGEKPLAWVAEQNARTVGALARSDDFRTLEARLLSIYDSRDRIPFVQKRGAWFYNFWQDADHERGVWRRTTLDEYRKASPAWETVLDLDALGKAENENWVWHGSTCLPPAYRHCLVALSRGGADADVTREFDMERKEFVAGGFALPEAKGGASWIDENTVYVTTDFGAGTMTESGYPRIAKIWRRGTPLESASIIFEGKASDVAVSAWRDHTPGFVRDFAQRAITFYSSELYQRKGDQLVRIDVPLDANASVHREWLLVELRTDWEVGGTVYPAGALLAADYDRFMAGERRFDILFRPSERSSLAGFSATRNHLLVNELDNVHNRIYRLAYRGGRWERAPLEGLPDLGTVGASAVDAYETDDYFLTVTDFVTPSTLSIGTVGRGAPERLKSLPDLFDRRGLVITQHDARSLDGTRIPYFQVSRRGIALDGTNPTLLYGYGGFEISMLPSYSAGVGAAWLEKGGVYVVANIRGGGEFGPRWHQAALKGARHKAYEDFIAVAEDLVARRVTSTPRLGVMGGSNGGLLTGNMLTMRPDLFGAVVSQVPLLDMRRYHKLLAGASWMGEYGDPDDPAQWEFIKTFSPYHNVKPGAKYPPTLIVTSTRDDRVHPGHARKMVALMESLGTDVQYYENIEGGHGGAANNKQAAFMSSLAFTFLWTNLGKAPPVP